jgi:hypothetical protein
MQAGGDGGVDIVRLQRHRALRIGRLRVESVIAWHDILQARVEGHGTPPVVTATGSTSRLRIADRRAMT